MPSIIIAASPAHGHVTPLLTVARGFVERGDDVRFITGAAFADRVTATGATHIALPPEADFDFDGLDATFPERARLKGTRAITHDVEHIWANPAKPQYETIMATHTAQPADVVLAEPTVFGAAFLLAHPRPTRPAVVVCGVIPLAIPSTDTAPFGMGSAAGTVVQPPAQRHLGGCEPPRLGARRRHPRSAPPRRARPSPAEPDSELARLGRRGRPVHRAFLRVPSFRCAGVAAFVGPLSGTGSQSPRPDWWGDLDGSRPVIHVTQGTAANKDYAQVIAPTLEALAGEGVLVAVATGGRPLDTLPPLPANARAAEFLPYDELLPRTDVFVTNGGYGGVQYALRYGLPIVATGGKEDKPEVGARVAWSGVGRRIRTERPTPSALRRDILAVLNQPRYQQASRRVAAEMAAAPGFTGLADIVDRLVAGPTRLAADNSASSTSVD